MGLVYTKDYHRIICKHLATAAAVVTLFAFGQPIAEAGTALKGQHSTLQSSAETGQVQVSPLISPDILRQLMDVADPQIVDIRNATAWRSLYSFEAGHIPGAVNVPYGKWREIWSDPLSVPSDAALTEAVQKAGLTKDRPVVLVHSSAAKGNFGSAAWVYWVLKSSGFTNIAILNGGIRGWNDMGGAIEKGKVDIVRSTQEVQLDDTWLATHEDVDAVIAGTSRAQLLDARPLHQIMNDASIEGSFTLNAEELLTGENGAAADDYSIFLRIKEADLNWQHGEVITYCNNGALAAVDWFMANEIAGIGNVKVYGHSLKARERAGRAATN